MVARPATRQAGKKKKEQPPAMKQTISSKSDKRQDNNHPNEATEEFLQQMREAIRQSAQDLMEAEVAALCGRRYAPLDGGGYRRAGNEKGVMYHGGGKASLERPRVRRRRADGREEEAPLVSYAQVRSKRNIEREVFGLMQEGVSTRGTRRLSGETISPATASRLWVEGSAQKLEQLRSRDLSKESYFGLMIDGVFLSRELVVIVALGITCRGEKRVLDFAVGSSESYEVARELVVRLVERGFRPQGRLLAILDGSAALRKAVLELWPTAVIQHCVIHKERNLHRYLRRADHAECSRLCQRLRWAQGVVAGREALDALRRFLKPRNAAALASLDEAGEDLIALHLLNAPATLQTSLLSTNLIENAIRNYRRQTGRVTRWRAHTDQVDRWTATGLLWIEAGFHKIKGHADLAQLLKALAAPAVGCVTSSPLRGVPTTSGTLSTPPTAQSPLTVTANL
jgi:transposase-like protein